MSDENEKTPPGSNKFMSDDERDWLSDHWHHVNDIGDADDREEWRDRTRLRRLGIDPDSDESEVLAALDKLHADDEDDEDEDSD